MPQHHHNQTHSSISRLDRVHIPDIAYIPDKGPRPLTPHPHSHHTSPLLEANAQVVSPQTNITYPTNISNTYIIICSLTWSVSDLGNNTHQKVVKSILTLYLAFTDLLHVTWNMKQKLTVTYISGGLYISNRSKFHYFFWLLRTFPPIWPF